MRSNASRLTAGAVGILGLLASGAAFADDQVYAGFPVTVKGYAGDKTSSVSYSGQIARHVLHDSLKKLAGKGNGSANAELKAMLESYYSGSDAGRAIVAPVIKGAFKIKQTSVDEISKDKNIGGKTYGGAVTSWPNAMTGPEVVAFWIDKASSAKGGVDTANGYNYPQLISKFILGAMAYNQAVDNYLDENLGADRKPNDKPYSDGAAYTGKEHVWDEAWGYFGAPAHVLKLTPNEVYAIAKQSEDAMTAADMNGDGVIDLKTEMTFGPAYFAASYDRGGAGTTYLHTIAGAFLDGRKLIASANGEALTDAQRSELRGHARVIEENWQKVLAESVFKYAGSVYKDAGALMKAMEAGDDIAKPLANYIKHWGEMKGFAMALQTGRSNLGETAVSLNRLIGFGPVMPNSSQVVDVDSKGQYVKGEAGDLSGYMLHMLKVQKLMLDNFGIKARVNDALSDLADLSGKLNSGGYAEND